MAYAAPPDSADGAALAAGAGRRRAWLLVAGALMIAGIAAVAGGVSPGVALFFVAAITAITAIAAWRHNLRQAQALAEAQRRLADLEQRSAQAPTGAEVGATRDIAALQERVAALDQFVYRAAHDLKEPLRGISNHAQFLVEDYADQLGEDGCNRLQRLASLSRSTSDRLSALREEARAREWRADDPRQERPDDQA